MRATPRRDEMVDYLKTHQANRKQLAAALNCTLRAVESAIVTMRRSGDPELANVLIRAKKWTEEDDAQLRELSAAQVPVEEIARILDRCDHVVYRRRVALGIRCVARKEDSDLTKQIIALSQRPQGVGSREIPGYSGKQITQRGSQLNTQGRVFAKLITYKNLRFFSSPEAAEKAYRLAHTMLKASKPKTAPRWDADAPMVITPKTKYTYAPPPVRSLRTNTYPQF